MTGLLTSGCGEKKRLVAGGFTEGEEKGLYLFDFSTKNGNLDLLTQADAGPNPSFFCFSADKKLIYAADEVMDFKGGKGGGITTLEYDNRNNSLTKKSEILVPYGSPCYISISPDGKYLLLANYSSSSVSVVRLDSSGIPGQVTDTILYKSDSLAVSHPHKIMSDPAGKHIYVTDLGLNRIMIYDLDTVKGKLKPFRIPLINLPGSSGPRHFTFNKNGTLMYLINEVGSTVMVLAVSDDEGLKIIQTLITVAEGFTGRNACAEIVISKDGRFVYGSNRGENSIVVFGINDDGTLKPEGRISCGGNWPRNFSIDPSGRYLLVANQRSDNISVFRINEKTGLPEGPVSNAQMKTPACLRFME